MDTFHSVPDVGPDFEVRATRIPDGCLIVRGNDADDRRYVLVTGDAPEVEIRGWLLGADAKKVGDLRNPNSHREAWFVPQERLNRFQAFQYPEPLPRGDDVPML